MRRVLSALLAVAALAGCGSDNPSGAAAAGAAWAPAVRLAPGPADDGSVVYPFTTPPRVGVDAAGNALVAWSAPVRRGDQTAEVKVAVAAPGNAFGPPKDLASDVFSAELAVAPNGRAVLAWRPRRGPPQVALGTTAGGFGTPRALGRRGTNPTVAIGGDGVAILFSEAPGSGRVHARLVPPVGEAGPQVDLGRGGLDAEHLATGPSGIVAALAGDRLMLRRPGGPIRRAKRPPGSPEVLAVGPDGGVAVAAITGDACGESECYGQVAVRQRRPGSGRFGPRRRLPLAGRARSAFGPAIAYTATGRLVVAWTEDSDLSDYVTEVEKPFGRSFAWTGGRPKLLHRRTGRVELATAGRGVLALSGRGCRLRLVRPGGIETVPSPPGRGCATEIPLDAGRFAVRGDHVVIAWEQLPDLGVHAVTGTLSVRR